MSKIKLYKNSPLNVLGGRLQTILKYQDIAQAGAPQSLTGRAVMELGRLFTQMDMGEKEPLSEQVGVEMDSYEDMKFEDRPQIEFDPNFNPNSVDVIDDRIGPSLADFDNEDLPTAVTPPVTPVEDTTSTEDEVEVSYLKPTEELDNTPTRVGQRGSANSSGGVSNVNYKKAQNVKAIADSLGVIPEDDELYDPDYYKQVARLTPEQLKAKLDKKNFPN